jgi:uncharacterized membrane protein YeaQ/YmgE (transglycosylase-associated protein family)
MSFLWYILIGLVAGFVASVLTRGSGYGILINLVVGIVGGVLGGWIFGLLGINVNPGSIVGNLITATVGAIVLLLIVSLLSRKKG